MILIGIISLFVTFCFLARNCISDTLKFYLFFFLSDICSSPVLMKGDVTDFSFWSQLSIFPPFFLWCFSMFSIILFCVVVCLWL